MTFRDTQPERPAIAKIACPGCGTSYPRELLAVYGPSRCGECSTDFALRPGVGVVRLGDVPVVEAEPPPPAVPSTAPHKRYLPDAPVKGRASASVRMSQTERDALQAAADAEGVSLNAYSRRALRDAVEMDAAISRHPDNQPATRATREDT